MQEASIRFARAAFAASSNDALSSMGTSKGSMRAGLRHEPSGVGVTGARVTGRTIVVRSYSGLRFFEPDADTLRPIGRPVDLLDPRQTQGEGVDFIADGRLVLTGEGGRQRATLAVLRCDPRAPPPDTTP